MSVTWAVVLVLVALIMVALGAYAWHRRRTPGILTFSLLMFAVATWSLAYALELLSQDLSSKLLWIKMEYPGIVAAPVLVLVFALQYTGRGRWLSRRNVALLALIPVSTLVLVWTREAHHLFYSRTWLESSELGPMLRIEYGPYFWLHTAFSYLCLLSATSLLALAFLRSSHLYRRQAGIFLLGSLVPWIGNVLYLAGLTPWPGLDLTPLVLSFTGLFLAYGLFRYKLLQIVPVALRTVVDGMPTAMIVLDGEGRIADLNPAARRLFGLGNQEVIGRPARQVLSPTDLVERFAEVVQADTEVVWGSGDQRRVYRVTISPLDDRPGVLPARLILVLDVTEQVQARETLAEANQRLLALQEGTAALTGLLDPATLFDLVMDRLNRLLPCDRAILGLYDEEVESLTYVASRGFDPEELAQIEHTALQRHPGWVVRHKAPLLVKDANTDPRVKYSGAPRNRSMIIAPVLYQDRCLGVLGLGSDEPAAYTPADQDLLMAFANQVAVALENALLYKKVKTWAAEQEKRVAAQTRELQETQAQLLHAEKLAALGQLSAGIAHEIAHPLGLIQGYLELLADDKPDLTYVSQLQDAVERLISLLNQLRSFARPAAGERSLVIVSEVVQKVLALAEKELMRSRVKVSQRIVGDLPLIEADEQQLEQVFLNLVLNARDAMPQGGELQVVVRQMADQVVIEFTDTGTGISPENLRRVFEPYFTTKKHKGTGLGLAICRRIVEAHGGRIEVTSQLGEGTTFRVYLLVHDPLG